MLRVDLDHLVLRCGAWDNGGDGNWCQALDRFLALVWMGLDRIGWNGIYLRGLAIGVTRASCRCRIEREERRRNFTGGQECDRNMFCVISCRYYIFMCMRLYAREPLVRGGDI